MIIKEGNLPELDKMRLLERIQENKPIDYTMRELEEAFGTVDFSNLLTDAANVSLMQGYGQVQPVWKVVSKVVTRNDFKTNNVVTADGMGLLDKRLEQEPVELTKPTDRKETYAVYPYEKAFGLTMEANANDETGRLMELMRGWGNAAVNTLNDFVWGTSSGLLTGSSGVGATMSDSVAVFDASGHGNLATADLTYATLTTAFAAMMTQTDESGSQMAGAVPRYLCVAPAAYAKAYSLTQGSTLIATATDATSTHLTSDSNPWKPMGLQIVVIDTLPTDVWVLSADPNVSPVVEMGFYQGKTEPTVYIQPPESDAEFWSRTRYAKCQLIFGGCVADYRGLYKGA
jgi:hypothetical protein